MLNYNILANKTNRQLKNYPVKKQNVASFLEDSLILILNHLPYSKSDIIRLNYKDFFRTYKKAVEIAIQKKKKNG